MKAEEERAMFRLCEALSNTNGDHFKRHEAIAAALTLAQQEARAERDREWREAVAKAHTRTCAGCRDCSQLRALLEGK